MNANVDTPSPASSASSSPTISQSAPLLGALVERPSVLSNGTRRGRGMDGPPHTAPDGQEPAVHHDDRPSASWLARARTFAGRGAEPDIKRRAVADFAFTLAFDVAQIAVFAVVFVVGVHTPSPADASETEWFKSGIGFGVLDLAWIGRTVLSVPISVWELMEKLRLPAIPPLPPADVEAGVPAQDVLAEAEHVPQVHRIPQEVDADPAAEPSLILPSTRRAWKARLWYDTIVSGFCLLYSFIWLGMSSDGIHQAPHLFGLTLAMYPISVVLFPQAYAIGLRIFFDIGYSIVVAPVNCFRIHSGRRPIGPAVLGESTIAKLTPSLVARIPLVLYIPPPPDSDSSTTRAEPEVEPEDDASHPRVPAFLRMARQRVSTWEDGWARAELRGSMVDLPLVRMEENRATCAICHEDFQPPPRVLADDAGGSALPGATTGAGYGTPRKMKRSGKTRVPNPESRALESAAASSSAPNPLSLPDVGEGTQPLRLLTCGHAFHKSCADTWLTGVSGRCPTCNTPVNIRELRKRRN